MSIVSHVKLVVLRPKKAGEMMVTQWAEMLKANAERVNEKRKIIIKNEESFQKLIAGVSHKNWAPFINPAFHSKAGANADEIIGGRNTNLKESYDLYNRKLDEVFAEVDGVPAKRFKDAVENAKLDYSKGVAKRTLPLTGDRLTGRGPAAIAALWLVGDARVDGYLRGGDSVLEGGPFRIITEDSDPAFKSGLTGRIIQAGAYIIKMERNPVAMTRQNGLTNHLVQSFVDPALGLIPFAAGAESHVDFIVDNSELYLDVKVSQI